MDNKNLQIKYFIFFLIVINLISNFNNNYLVVILLFLLLYLHRNDGTLLNKIETLNPSKNELDNIKIIEIRNIYAKLEPLKEINEDEFNNSKDNIIKFIELNNNENIDLNNMENYARTALNNLNSILISSSPNINLNSDNYISFYCKKLKKKLNKYLKLKEKSLINIWENDTNNLISPIYISHPKGYNFYNLNEFY